MCALAPLAVADLAPAMDFEAPAPGTYRLERIQRATPGTVRDINGRSQPLARYTTGRITLLSFMYSSCTDVGGCPYAYVVFNLLKARLQKEPDVARQVRLVSLSFDPTRDTPEVMKLYGAPATAGNGVEWDFLTTASYRELLPILDGFGQDVGVDVDPATNKPRGTLSHVLKVFLLDENGYVREIYSTAYLLPQVVYNDIKTLLLEKEANAK